MDIPTKFDSTAEMSRHDLAQEKFVKFCHGSAEELLLWLKHHKLVNRAHKKLTPHDRFAITGEVTLGDSAMSQWEECKARTVHGQELTKQQYKKTMREFTYLYLNIEDASCVMQYLTNGIRKPFMIPIRKCGEQITEIFALLKLWNGMTKKKDRLDLSDKK